ncbi:sporulation integral membrane protein YtvI [Peptococcaceae bacterium]|nr:sporulation integral membrane protein YtvI [Peptococcaceae bacterium]
MVNAKYQTAIKLIVFTSAGLLTLLAIAALLKLAVLAFPLLLPFLIAIFAAFMMEPIVSFLQNRLKMPRSIAVLFTMLLIFGVLGGVLTLLIIQLIKELTYLSAEIPVLTKEIKMYINQMMPAVMNIYEELPEDAVLYLHDVATQLIGMLQTAVGVIVNYLAAFITLLPNAVIFVIVMLLAIYFISKDKQQIIDFCIKILPVPYGERIVKISREVLWAFCSYLKAIVILATMTTIISIIGLEIIGAEYAVTMGLLIGLCDMLPVIGPATVIFPWTIWMFITGDIAMGIKLLILYAVIFSVRGFSEARIVAANLNLHPLPVLISMYAGLKLLGVLGLVIGPICLIAVQAVLKASNMLPNVK